MTPRRHLEGPTQCPRCPCRGLRVAARTSTDPLGRATTLFKDVRGLTLTTQEMPAPTTFSGELALDLPTDIRGDARIMASAATGAEPLQTVALHDPLGRLVQVTDTAGNVTTHTWDMLDNLTASTNPDGGTTERLWTPAGQLAAEADQVRLDRGERTWFRHDPDRLVAIDYPDTAHGDEPTTPDVSWTWGNDGATGNAAGRITTVVDGAMTRDWAYDVDGNVASETARRRIDPWDRGETAVQSDHVTSWEYDSLGRVTTLAYPSDEVITHQFDRGGSVSGITSSMPQPDVVAEDGTHVPRDPRAFTYLEQVDYDEFGAMVRLETGTGVVTTYDHDPARQFLTSIDTDATATEQYDGTTSAPAQLQRMRHQYDDGGNTLAAVNRLYTAEDATALADGDAIAANGLPGPSISVYAHDGHHRLTAAESRYVDRKEDRFLSLQSDRNPDGTLHDKQQVASTISTTGNGNGGGNGGGNGNNAKKNRDDEPDQESTLPGECDDNQGSGGGLHNQDPELTWTLGEFAYESGHRLQQAGTRAYFNDANGSLRRWEQPCADAATTEVRQYTWDADNRIVAIAQGTRKDDGRIVENATTQYRWNAEGEMALERRPSETFFVNRHWRVSGGEREYASVFLGDDRIAMHFTEATSDLPGAAPVCPEGEVCECDPLVHRCAEQDVAGGDCPDDDPAVVLTDDGFCQPLHPMSVFFLHPDAVGSTRVVTNEVGGVFQYVDYTPTGTVWVAGQSTIQHTPPVCRRLDGRTVRRGQPG